MKGLQCIFTPNFHHNFVRKGMFVFWSDSHTLFGEVGRPHTFGFVCLLLTSSSSNQLPHFIFSASCVCRHIFEFHVFLRVCSVFLHLATHIFGFLCVFSSFSCIPWGRQVSCYFTIPLCWHSALSTLVLTVHCKHKAHIPKLCCRGKVSTSVWFDIWKLWKYGKYFTLAVLAPNGCHVWWRSSTWQSPIGALLCSIGAADTLVRIWGRFKTGFSALRLCSFLADFRRT